MTEIAHHEDGPGAVTDIPKDDLFRCVYPGLELRETSDGMPVMNGHFAVFNQWTEINSSYEGRFLERFAPGAFAKTLRENGSRIQPLFQHGRDPQVGDKPLGTITVLEEDETGPYYEVELLDTSYNRDLIPGLRKDVYGASFRFSVVKEEKNMRPPKSAYNPKGLPERTVQEARVSEFGPVTFPAYLGATAGVRSLTDRFRPGGGVEEDRQPVERTAERTAEVSERLYARSRAYVAEHVWMASLPLLAVISGILAERTAGIRLTEQELADRIGTRDAIEPTAPSPGIAVIPISGPIVPHAGVIDDTSSQLTSIDKIQAEFRAALADSEVGAILFNVDSPGGSADLVPEFAAEILASRGDKPIWAVANTDAASAAYFIASACDVLCVTPSGYVGSIGVYSVHQDISGRMEQLGIDTTFISAGKYKVDGNPFEPLSDSAAEEMQAQVDAIYQVFLQAVSDGRGVPVDVVEKTFGQGRMVMAADAVNRGMADQVATIDQALLQLQQQIADDTSSDTTDGPEAVASSPDDALDTPGADTSHSVKPSREPAAGALPDRKPNAGYLLNKREVDQPWRLS